MFCSIHWLLFSFFLVVPVSGWEVNLIHLLTTLATRFVFRFACLDDLFELFGLVTPEKTSQPIGVFSPRRFMNFVAVNSLAFETEILRIIRDSLFQIPNNKITTKVEKYCKSVKK